jgi:hypothetical protein
MSAPASRAETMITGISVRLNRARISLSTWKPSICGMLTSSSTTSGGSSFTSTRPSVPVRASMISCPYFWRDRPSSSRFSSMSSMMRMRPRMFGASPSSWA